jgi:VWFA-related protein
MKQRLMVLVLLICLLHPLTFSQSPAQQAKPTSEQAVTDDQDVIKINTNLVQVDAVVTRNGKQVTDLRAEDFVILQDGKPQPITNFSYVSNVPAAAANVAAPTKTKDKTAVPPVPSSIRPHDVRRTMAFVVDDLGLMFESIDRAKSQLRKFINEDLSPNDLVAIIRTGGEIGALQQFTTDRRLLLRAVDQLKWNTCSRVGFSATQPPSEDRACTDNYALSLRAMRYIVGGMARLPGRKSLLMLSDSMPVDIQTAGPTAPSAPASPSGASAMPAAAAAASSDSGIGEINTNYQQSLQRIAELAIRGSVVIYAADTRGLVDTFPDASVRITGGGRAGRQVMASLQSSAKGLFMERQGSGMIAKDTGGYLIYNSNDFGMKKVAEDQQGYYLIGFRPAGETFNRAFHGISIKLKPKGLSVRTRAGFFGVTDEDARNTQQAALRNVHASLVSPFGINEIAVRLNALFANSTASGSLLRSFIYVNARDLTFADGPNGLHVAAFDVDSILFGDNGAPLYERSQTANLQLNEEQYRQTLSEGVIYGFDVPVKRPGAFQFRVAVRDHSSAHIGTAGQVVEVPDLAKKVLTVSSLVITPDTAATANTSNAALPATGEQDRFAVPGSRAFRQGSGLVFAYAVYNAQLDLATHLPQLTRQTRIFREGQLIHTGEIIPLTLSGQSDPERITGGGRLLLGSDFPVGEYVLQIVVTDNLAKEKQRTSTQWIDFEIVK